VWRLGVRHTHANAALFSRFSCVCRRFSRFFAMETAAIVSRDSGGVLAECFLVTVAAFLAE